MLRGLTFSSAFNGNLRRQMQHKPTAFAIKRIDLTLFSPSPDILWPCTAHLGTFFCCVFSQYPTRAEHTSVCSLLMQTIGAECRLGAENQRHSYAQRSFLEDWLRTILVLPANETFKVVFGCSELYLTYLSISPDAGSD